MEIKKSHWDVGAGHIAVHTPIMKVDTENRIVSGFASLDNEDQQGDVVEKQASVKAFSEFRGNIREMHQPIAVGRMINFTEDTFVDPKTEKAYNGIWVSVKVSKGAQDTWEKVLDGTLSGFSIGGSVLKSAVEVRKSEDGVKSVNVIKDYRLTELSLVDSPANQFANVFSINKVDGVETASGMVSETVIENVFYCENDGMAKSANAETKDCSLCSKEMKVVGWIEKGSDDSVAKISEVIRKYEGGVHMPEENTNDVAVNEDNGTTVEGLQPEVAGEVSVEEVITEDGEHIEEEAVDTAADNEAAADVVKVDEVSSSDLEEAVKVLTAKIEGLTKSAEGSDESYAAFKKSLDEVVTDVAALKAGQEEIEKSVTGIKGNLAELEKNLQKVDTSSATKKSVSTEPELRKSSNSIWDNSPMSLRK